jgi:hypothetical protein
MTSAANRNKEVMLTGETHAGDYVGGASTARDSGWPAIDHGIRNRASGVIAILARAKHRAADSCPEFLNSRGVHAKPPLKDGIMKSVDAVSGSEGPKLPPRMLRLRAHCQADFKGSFEENEEVKLCRQF